MKSPDLTSKSYAKDLMALPQASGSMSSNTTGEGEIRCGTVKADLVECTVALPVQYEPFNEAPRRIAATEPTSHFNKFPTSGDQKTKLERFFGDDRIPAVLVDRINNEYSHLCGVFERGETPVEVPEMKTAAAAILERLKQDREQYNALLESIGKQLEDEGDVDRAEAMANA